MKKDYYFVCTGSNAIFEDGNRSILLAVSEKAEELAPGKRGGQLVSLVIGPKLFDRGLCPGASGMVTGEVVESGKRDDGTPWLRLRAEVMSVTKKGNMPLALDKVEFADE